MHAKAIRRQEIHDALNVDMTTPKHYADEIVMKIAHNEAPFVLKKFSIHRNKWRMLKRPNDSEIHDALGVLFNDCLFTTVSITIKGTGSLYAKLFSEDPLITIALWIEEPIYTPPNR